MSLYYLHKTVPVTLDANGNGTVAMRPDVGQWWAPVMMRVSTLSQVTPIAYCSVHHGSTAVVNSSTLIDDTYTANGDTSSMCSGVIVIYGEALIAKFSHGKPGDIALLTVYGTASDIPQGIGELPTIPGTHFQGRAPVEIVQSLLDTTSNNAITPGTLVDLTATGLLDMRAFNGWYFSILATAAAAGPGTPLTCQIRMHWKLDADPISTTLYSTSWEIFCNTTSGTPLFNGGTFQLQDNTHGPFLQLQVRNSSPAGNINTAYRFVGTSHQFPSELVKHFDFGGLPPGNGMLISTLIPNIAAAATGTFYGLTGVGKAMMTMKNNSMPFTVDMFAGSRLTIAYDSFLLPASSRLQRYMTLPKNGMVVNCLNTGAANGSIEIHLVSEYEQYG